jgi:hypothetical protein
LENTALHDDHSWQRSILKGNAWWSGIESSTANNTLGTAGDILAPSRRYTGGYRLAVHGDIPGLGNCTCDGIAGHRVNVSSINMKSVVYV